MLSLFLFQYPSDYRIGRVTIPTLFLSGLNDELVPPSMMSQLYNVSADRSHTILLQEKIVFLNKIIHKLVYELCHKRTYVQISNQV